VVEDEVYLAMVVLSQDNTHWQEVPFFVLFFCFVLHDLILSIPT
jgi:hypothetical protein